MPQHALLEDGALQRTTSVAAAEASRGAVPRPVRVMHVLYALQPGGMEFGVVKLVNGLDRAMVRSSICSTCEAGSMKTHVAADVPVFELGRRPGNDPRLICELVRLFRREQPHIVHTHAWGTLVEGLVAARLARVPIVIHGEHGTLQLKRHQRLVQRVSWWCTDQVLSVSSRLAERMALATGFAPGRIRTIRNGVDLSRFGSIDRSAARRCLGLRDEEIAIGTVGRLVPVKDQGRLLDAAARLRDLGLPVTTLIAGEGPLRDGLLKQAEERGLGASVRLLGHRHDVEAVLAALDVFVLPSISEGLSNTILEAMATGLPVVATRVGGADELVADGTTGLLVPPRDSASLARALERLIRDSGERAVMGTEARRRARAEFDLPVMLSAYQALYLDIAAKRTIRRTQAAGVH